MNVYFTTTNFEILNSESRKMYEFWLVWKMMFSSSSDARMLTMSRWDWSDSINPIVPIDI